MQQKLIRFGYRSLALMVGGPQYLSIVRVDETIRSGRPAFETVYGSSFWVHLDENPGYNTSQVRETVLTMPGAEEQHTFQQALSSVSELMDPAIVADYPFGKFSSLIDIGGGQGAFVRRLQLQHPTLRTAIFDQAAVIEQTRAANQCNGSRLIAGDFHQSVSSGFDAYFLKQIMHDWSDTHCEVILKTIAVRNRSSLFCLLKGNWVTARHDQVLVVHAADCRTNHCPQGWICGIARDGVSRSADDEQFRRRTRTNGGRIPNHLGAGRAAAATSRPHAFCFRCD